MSTMLSKTQLFKKYGKKPKTKWPASYVTVVLKALYEHQKTCQWCGIALTKPGDMSKQTRATMDHIVEKRNDGKSTLENMKLSCERCNNGRDAMGGCIGALAAYSAVVGPRSSLRKLQDYVMQSGKAKKRYEQKHNPSFREPERNPLNMTIFGVSTSLVKPKPDAKILYCVAYSKNKTSAARRIAKDGGYDAMWNLATSKLEIINLKAFEMTHYPLEQRAEDVDS